MDLNAWSSTCSLGDPGWPKATPRLPEKFPQPNSGCLFPWEGAQQLHNCYISNLGITMASLYGVRHFRSRDHNPRMYVWCPGVTSTGVTGCFWRGTQLIGCQLRQLFGETEQHGEEPNRSTPKGTKQHPQIMAALSSSQHLSAMPSMKSRCVNSWYLEDSNWWVLYMHWSELMVICWLKLPLVIWATTGPLYQVITQPDQGFFMIGSSCP